MPIDLPPEKHLPAWLEAAIDHALRLRITRIRLARAVLWLSGRALDRGWFRLSDASGAAPRALGGRTNEP
jgi:hypothetical protein